MSFARFGSLFWTSLLLLFACVGSLFAQVQIQGVAWMEAENDTNNRLRVLVLNAENLAAVQLRFTSNGTGKLYRYTEKANEAVEVSDAVLVDGMWQLSNPQLDCGYFVSNARGLPDYYWFVDYKQHKLPQATLQASHHPSDPCQRVLLNFGAPISQINYYLPIGLPRILKRELKISYPSLEWIEQARAFSETTINESAESSEQNEIAIKSSLTDVSYTLLGDRFTQGLSIPFQAIKSNVLESKRIELHAYVDPVKDDGSAETAALEPGQLVSAPYKVELKAYANEPVVGQHVWRVYRTEEGPEFSLLSYNGSSTEYTFSDAGRYSLMVQVSNRDASCNDERSFDDYVQVSESMLKVPNAFSPGTSEGVNDIFRVKHKSLIRFDAKIYSSWGQELYRWTDPNGGWDGKFRGKLVPTGVYYYVISAEGADGIKYQRKGDINILRPMHDNDTNLNNPTPSRRY